MTEKKELNQKQLEKVSGGVNIGDNRIVECESCKTQFDPDTAVRGADEIEITENGAWSCPVYKCPGCNEYHRIKVIQLKQEDLRIG